MSILGFAALKPCNYAAILPPVDSRRADCCRWLAGESIVASKLGRMELIPSTHHPDEYRRVSDEVTFV